MKIPMMNRPLPAVFLSLVASALSTPVDGQQFQFNPPDGATYQETVHTTRVKTIGSLGTQKDETEASARVHVSQTAAGFSLVSEVLSGSMSRDGQKIDNPLVSLPIGMTFTTEIDRRGRIRTVHGFGELLTRMKAALPPQARQSLSATLTEEALVNREVAEWNGRIGSLVGRKVKVGEVWTSTARFDLPTGGTVVYYSATRIVGREKRDGRDCVRLRYSYNTDAQALRSFVGKSVASLLKGSKAAKDTPRVSNVSLVGSGERLIDLHTMLIHAETATRTIKMHVDVPGHGKIPTTMVEKKRYRYRFEPVKGQTTAPPDDRAE